MGAFAVTNKSPFVVQNVPIQGIAAGSIANAIVPVGQTYLTSFFLFTIAGAPATQAQIIAQIGYIQILVNGVDIGTLTGQDWCELAEFYRTGINGATGFVPIFYERPWMQELVVQRGFAYGMSGQNSFQFNIQLLGGATINGISLCHRVAVEVETLGRHVEYLKQSHTFSSTGQDRIIDLPQDDRSPEWPDSIAAIHLRCTKANVSNIIVKADKVELWNGTVAQLERMYLLATDARTPQTNLLSLDFMNRNWMNGQLPDNMSTFEVIPTWTVAPGTYPIIIEKITGRPGEVKS